MAVCADVLDTHEHNYEIKTSNPGFMQINCIKSARLEA
jgi:hypothetical protein